MQPLNPFLAAFFKSPLPAQCLPAQGHVLLVPSTDVLLTSRETEAPPGASLADSVSTEEFLASHVLRIPDPAKPAGAAAGGGKESTPNLREMRGKAKQYNTINGRNVVIKDNVIYTNKGASAPRVSHWRWRRATSTDTSLFPQGSRSWPLPTCSATPSSTRIHWNPGAG